MNFDTTIHTGLGEIRLTVQDGSTMADLVVTSPHDAVTVYCGHRALSDLAAATGAASHNHLNDTVGVETEGGVTAVGQPQGLIEVMRGDRNDGGANITVDDRNGHFIDGWLDPAECSQLSVACSAAANGL